MFLTFSTAMSKYGKLRLGYGMRVTKKQFYIHQSCSNVYFSHKINVGSVRSLFLVDICRLLFDVQMC